MDQTRYYVAPMGRMAPWAHYDQRPYIHGGSPAYMRSWNTQNGQYEDQPSLQPSIEVPSMSTDEKPPVQLLRLPATKPSAPQHYSGVLLEPRQSYAPQKFDLTGQLAPPGMKPRVTATLWEEEGSLCVQVEANRVCVARREDNHMINGTKLLNVAGMTRGRRDEILKNEKVRHIVKIGPTRLTGVWIPFERALHLANNEKITDLLYPLFVHNISGFLYRPTNQNRSNAVVATSERRQLESNQSAPISGAYMCQPPHSRHPEAGHLGVDSPHTFPMSSTSASSLMGLSSQGSFYEYGESNIDSIPTTPAPSPPLPPLPPNLLPSMQPYQIQQSYNNMPYHSAPPPSYCEDTSHIVQQNLPRFGHPPRSNRYMKNEMEPTHCSEGTFNSSCGPYSYPAVSAIGSLARGYPHLSSQTIGPYSSSDQGIQGGSEGPRTADDDDQGDSHSTSGSSTIEAPSRDLTPIRELAMDKPGFNTSRLSDRERPQIESPERRFEQFERARRRGQRQKKGN